MQPPHRNKLDPRLPGESWSAFIERWGRALGAWKWLRPRFERMVAFLVQMQSG